MATKLCPQTSECRLHRSIGMTAALRVWQSFYCEGSFARCERFKLAASGSQVPERLLPNGRLLEAAPPEGGPRSERAA
jgi:hypothetical protein